MKGIVNDIDIQYKFIIFLRVWVCIVIKSIKLKRSEKKT